MRVSPSTVSQSFLSSPRSILPGSINADDHNFGSNNTAQGRWLTVYEGKTRLVGQPKFERGFRFLASNVFNYNVEILSDYLTATARK
jgi:hypothetical protein